MVVIDETDDTGNIEEEFTSQGHTFRFKFTVLNLVDVQPYTFKKDIETKCDIFPTSWLLEMTFKQAPETSIASCILTAKRTDSMNETVKADIELSYGYVSCPSYQLERLFREEYSPGQEMRKCCDDILPFPEESENYIDDGIIVEVSITINCCLSD